MAQSRTAKGTAVSKTSGTTLTIPNLSMVGGDILIVAVAYNTANNAGPESIMYGPRDLSTELLEGKSFTTGGFRMRVYGAVIANTKTRDLVATWTNNETARAMIALSLHQAGKTNVTNDGENIAGTISTTGGAQPIDHINTVNVGFHATNGPAGDAIGSSTSGHTLGQRVGTTGDTTTSNITIQETYKIISASTIAAGSFVIGNSYQIKTIGTTDFTLIGATSNTVGEQFVATGVGTGTGDAYYLESLRSRLISLTSRDHIGVMAHMRPKRTYIVKDMVQNHRLMNENPDWVEVLIEDDNGNGFWINIHPEEFDGWSDAAVADRLAEYAATYEVNIKDSNLTYEADTTRDTRMATFVDDQLIL